jgi:hypothetical protein
MSPEDASANSNTCRDGTGVGATGREAGHDSDGRLDELTDLGALVAGEAIYGDAVAGR